MELAAINDLLSGLSQGFGVAMLVLALKVAYDRLREDER